MAQETTYTCDRCGKVIEEDESPTRDGRTGNKMDIQIRTSDVKNGVEYVASWKDLEEDWELCIPCGKEVRSAMKQALVKP